MKTKPHHRMKIATCCYCGARSTLPAEGAQRLVCHGCGAAIRRIEVVMPLMERSRGTSGSRKPAVPHAAERPHAHLDKDRPARRKKGKRRRRTLWSQIADAADDFDDLFDLFD